MRIKELWHDVEYNMFKAAMDYDDKEVDMLPSRLLELDRKVYEITMLLTVFAAITYAFSRVYEVMSMQSLGFIPPNFIQTTPLMVMFVMAAFMVYASEQRDRCVGLCQWIS